MCVRVSVFVYLVDYLFERTHFRFINHWFVLPIWCFAQAQAQTFYGKAANNNHRACGITIIQPPSPLPSKEEEEEGKKQINKRKKAKINDGAAFNLLFIAHTIEHRSAGNLHRRTETHRKKYAQKQANRPVSREEENYFANELNLKIEWSWSLPNARNFCLLLEHTFACVGWASASAFDRIVLLPEYTCTHKHSQTL